MSKTILSIVTPSFNQASYLPECLVSVATQGSIPIEHVVFDGGSSDESADVLREFACDHQHLRWISEKDNGQSHALNKGFRCATGEFIGWLNADDRYRPGCFDAVLQAFRDHPEIDVIYGDYTWIDPDGNTTQLRREIAFSRFVLLYHRVLYIPTTAMFFRRRILDQGQLLDETLQYAMDFEFFVRLNALGYKFLHVPQFLADFRFQPESKTSRFPERQLQEQSAIIRRYSPLLRNTSSRALEQVLTRGLRLMAAARRYTEKGVRGYYFTQFRPGSMQFK